MERTEINSSKLSKLWKILTLSVNNNEKQLHQYFRMFPLIRLEWFHYFQMTCSYIFFRLYLNIMNAEISILSMSVWLLWWNGCHSITYMLIHIKLKSSLFVKQICHRNGPRCRPSVHQFLKLLKKERSKTSTLTFHKLPQTYFIQLGNLAKIKPMLPSRNLEVLTVIPSSPATAKLVTKTSTGRTSRLFWHPHTGFLLNTKLTSLITYKSLHELAPSYITELFTHIPPLDHSDYPAKVSCYVHKTKGGCAFAGMMILMEATSRKAQ